MREILRRGIPDVLAEVHATMRGRPVYLWWDMDVFAIVKGTRNLAAARRLADWSASRKANEMYAAFATQVAWPGIENRMPNYPAGVAQSLIRNDFAWAAANRARILAEWTRRYDAKSAPR